MAFIITNEVAIWATGETVEAAWADFRTVMHNASIRVIDEPEEPAFGEAPPAVISEYRCEPATPALVADVAARGGAISWDHLPGGTACTDTEAA